MGLSLKDPETESRVRRLAEIRGVGITAAIRMAVDNELARDDADQKAEFERKLSEIRIIQEKCAGLPILMTDAEVDDWMYDENGLPH